MTKRILIVDDERDLVFIAKRFLSRLGGYEVMGASSGAEAIEAAKKFRPDFVVMDVTMPGMDGIEATAIIKEICPEAHVIIVTGHPTPSVAIKAMRTGAVNFVPKPFEMRQILKIIDSKAAAEGGSDENNITAEDADAKVAKIFSDYSESMKVNDEVLVSQDEINELLDKGVEK